MTTYSQAQSPKIPWRSFVQVGLIAGLVILYVGAVGMLESFHGRQVIQDVITLGQLLLFMPAFYAGYRVASHAIEKQLGPVWAIIGAVVAGVLTAVPTVIVLLLSEQYNIRSVLVNISNGWVDVVTFDNRRELMTGILLLAGYLPLASVLGALLAQLPLKIRRALIAGVGLTLTVGIFGQTVRMILQQLLPVDQLNAIFRRETLLRDPAIILLILSLIGAFIWSFGSKTAAQKYAALPPSSKKMSRRFMWIMLIFVLLALPWVIGRSLSDAMVTVGLYVLMGFGLNIAIGLAGLLDLGYVTNYAVGAYVMAVLTSTGPLGRGPDMLNFWIVIPIAIIVAMLTGFISALPVLRMRGDYLAIATLGFGEIIGKLAISDWLAPVIGGAQGVLFVPNPMFFGTEIKDPEQIYYVVLFFCVVTLFVSIRLNNSRTGRQWMAIREDEDVAAAMGINVPRAKLLAFTLSAATGGIAGAIFAAKVGTVFPNSFTLFISINVLSLIIVGGMGSNPGIVIGAIVLVGMPELLREFSDFRWLIYGVLLIFMMLSRPEGLLPSTVHKRELYGDESDDAQAKPAIADGTVTS